MTHPAPHLCSDRVCFLERPSRWSPPMCSNLPMMGLVWIPQSWLSVALCVQKNCRLIRDRSPGPPPQLSQSSWTLDPQSYWCSSFIAYIPASRPVKVALGASSPAGNSASLIHGFLFAHFINCQKHCFPPNPLQTWSGFYGILETGVNKILTCDYRLSLWEWEIHCNFIDWLSHPKSNTCINNINTCFKKTIIHSLLCFVWMLYKLSSFHWKDRKDLKTCRIWRLHRYYETKHCSIYNNHCLVTKPVRKRIKKMCAASHTAC